MKDEIIIDGITYIKKSVNPLPKEKNKFKDIFACKNINDLFEFAGEDIEAFKAKHSALTPKKLALELIEKGIEIINGDWKATSENTWHYPYFERTPSGFSFHDVGYYGVGFFDGVPASLVVENSEKAKLAGNIMLPEYNIYMNP